MLKDKVIKHSGGRKIKKSKALAYGERREKYWCRKCDAELTNDDDSGRAIKKRERQKAKLAIVKESWYCDKCSVEVYGVRCKYCGKDVEEES